ncbi:MAG: TolC family protein [Pirellulaceae bacterium]|nr:TolC family protein [Planctomycetales bacterium]
MLSKNRMIGSVVILLAVGCHAKDLRTSSPTARLIVDQASVMPLDQPKQLARFPSIDVVDAAPPPIVPVAYERPDENADRSAVDNQKDQENADSSNRQSAGKPTTQASSEEDTPSDTGAAARSNLQDTDDHQRDPLPQGSYRLVLDDVISSVHQSYPLLEVAYLENDLACGYQLAAWGAFDTKLKASSENGPLGFYQTYRHGAGFNTPVYQGGEVFGGYRVGRGSFQPWYLERQTNDGGEFKAGVRLPLLANRTIDARRAELWRATYDVQRTQPEIRSQLILFVRDATVAYWNWVAAGQQYDIGQRALVLAERRNTQLERRVELGDIDPPVLKDNLRTLALRESKLIDRERKREQAAIKLSLFYRDASGTPLVADSTTLPTFPDPRPASIEQRDMDIPLALSQRPELLVLDAQHQRARVDLAEACNDSLPAVDAMFTGSQDMGEPTSSKRDKSPFELEASLYLDVPLQRRKACGKMQVARAKLAQIAAKRQFTEDKIVAEVQYAFTALSASYERLDRARDARELAEYMADVERRKFDLGQSELLSVFLREQYAIEAADYEVESLLDYFSARADYAAALARDWPRYDEADPSPPTEAPMNLE